MLEVDIGVKGKKEDFEPFAIYHRFSSAAFGSSNSVQSPLDLNREGM